MSKKFTFDDALNYFIGKVKTKFNETDAAIGTINNSIDSANGSINSINEALASHTSTLAELGEKDASLEETKYDKTGGEITGTVYPKSNIVMPNNIGIRAKKADGTEAAMIYMTRGDKIALGNSATDTVRIPGNLEVDGIISGTTLGNSTIETSTVTLSNTAVSASSKGTVTKRISKSGYVPIGIVGVNLTGTNNDKCSIYRCEISTETMSGIDGGAGVGYAVNIYVRNNHTAQVTVAGNVTVLWSKSLFTTNALEV